MTNSGVYTIANPKGGKAYIGSTKNFAVRWDGHRNELRKGTHGNLHLQRSWNKHNEDTFEFVICEYVDDLKCLIEREQYWLDFHRMYVDVYNMVLAVDGSVMSEEIKRKISKTKMGHSPSEETRRKIGKATAGRPGGMLGKKHTEEAKRKMSEAHLGQLVSEETREDLSKATKAAWARGVFNSKETRYRMSESQMGNQNALGGKRSKEQKRKMSEVAGRPYPTFVNRDTGEVIPAGCNLFILCHKRKLSYDSMWNIAHGRTRISKGWMLENSPCPETGSLS